MYSDYKSQGTTLNSTQLTHSHFTVLFLIFVRAAKQYDGWFKSYASNAVPFSSYTRLAGMS